MKKPFIYFIIAFLFVLLSCTSLPSQNETKDQNSITRDDSFPVFDECNQCGKVKTKITKYHVDLLNVFRKKEIPYVPEYNELFSYGTLFKQPTINTNEYIPFTLFGLDTDYYIYEGKIQINGKSYTVNFGIYFHHDKNGRNRQCNISTTTCKNIFFSTTEPYSNFSVLTPYKMFICSNQDTFYNGFITQRLHLTSSDLKRNPNTYEYGNLPEEGIRSLFEDKTQNIQICDPSRTVLAEIKNESYYLYISYEDRRYEDLTIMIGLIETYRKILDYLDTMSIEAY